MKVTVDDVDSERRQPRLLGQLPVVLAVFGAFVLYSAVRMPMPAVNEPHFLTKAKHFWDNEFCPGDFYLNSPDAHVVFYQTVGLFTRWLTLEQTAWAGRVIALLALAVGWCALTSRLVAGRWSSLWAACLYLSIAAIGQASRVLFKSSSTRIFDLSGEWIVGGVEGKVFAYAFLFAAMALWIDGHRYRAALCAGLAISFHPVVGIWAVLAATFAASVLHVCQRQAAFATIPPTLSSSQWLTVVALLVVAALPGLVPALGFASAADADVQKKAVYIQVFYRLRHHLDPMAIPWSAYGSYLFLGAIWLWGRRRASLQPAEPWFAWFVVGSVLILLAGFVLGLRSGAPEEMPFWQLRASLLRFYPFRLADVMLPITASVVLVGIARQVAVPRVLCGAALCLFLGCLFLPTLDRNPSRMSAQRLADWKETCRWIASETPADAVFLTPTHSWAFKWHAGRPEFVSYKDCPQDAEGIVEWNDRLRFLKAWAQESRDESGQVSTQALVRLRELSRKYHEDGIRYIVSVDGGLGPFPLEPVYATQTCRVYSLENLARDRQ